MPDLRLEIPCADEDEFFARLADRVAQRGLRFPTATPQPPGTAVKVALELKNGETLAGDGVVDAHVELDGRPGVNVRILRFAPRSAPAPALAADEPGAAAEGPPALPDGDEPLGAILFGDAEGVASEPVPASFGSSTVSGEIFATVSRRTERARRAAIAVALAALLVAAAGLAAARWLLPPAPGAAVAAHVQAADRLVGEGRLAGRDGAIEHLLAAQRVSPADPDVQRRLSQIADLLEALAARALERGDVAVAAVHLGWAAQAAPDRPSIRARLDAIGRHDAPGRPPAAPRAPAAR